MAEHSIVQSEWIVYWLFDETCICPRWHGYIGRSGQWPVRLRQHQHSGKWPVGFRWCILFTGTKAECRFMEWQLRPQRKVGWNKSVGGKPNVFLTDASRTQMSVAAQKRVVSDATREKGRLRMLGTTNRGRPGPKSSEERAKISASNTGKKRLPEVIEQLRLRMLGTKYHLGCSHSEETKEQISLKKKGVPIHSEEHKRKCAERLKGNALTKGKPWSAARRLAWLAKKEI